jgi:hypothetical protein
MENYIPDPQFEGRLAVIEELISRQSAYLGTHWARLVDQFWSMAPFELARENARRKVDLKRRHLRAEKVCLEAKEKKTCTRCQCVTVEDDKPLPTGETVRPPPGGQLELDATTGEEQEGSSGFTALELEAKHRSYQAILRQREQHRLLAAQGKIQSLSRGKVKIKRKYEYLLQSSSRGKLRIQVWEI